MSQVPGAGRRGGRGGRKPPPRPSTPTGTGYGAAAIQGSPFAPAAAMKTLLTPVTSSSALVIRPPTITKKRDRSEPRSSQEGGGMAAARSLGRQRTVPPSTKDLLGSSLEGSEVFLLDQLSSPDSESLFSNADKDDEPVNVFKDPVKTRSAALETRAGIYARIAAIKKPGPAAGERRKSAQKGGCGGKIKGAVKKGGKKTKGGMTASDSAKKSMMGEFLDGSLEEAASRPTGDRRGLVAHGRTSTIVNLKPVPEKQKKRKTSTEDKDKGKSPMTATDEVNQGKSDLASQPQSQASLSQVQGLQASEPEPQQDSPVLVAVPRVVTPLMSSSALTAVARLLAWCLNRGRSPESSHAWPGLREVLHRDSTYGGSTARGLLARSRSNARLEQQRWKLVAETKAIDDPVAAGSLVLLQAPCPWITAWPETWVSQAALAQQASAKLLARVGRDPEDETTIPETPMAEQGRRARDQGRIIVNLSAPVHRLQARAVNSSAVIGGATSGTISPSTMARARGGGRREGQATGAGGSSGRTVVHLW